MSHQVKTKNGFSVLELITTMTMGGILVMITLPASGTMVERSKLTAAKRQFMSAYNMAKAAARRHRGIAELHIDQSAGTFWVELDPGVVGGTRDTVGGIRHVTGSGRQARSHDASLSSNRSLVCFDARGITTTRGSCQAGDLFVVITVNGRADTLRTTAMGQLLRRETAEALTP